MCQSDQHLPNIALPFDPELFIHMKASFGGQPQGRGGAEINGGVFAHEINQIPQRDYSFIYKVW